jgi:microcystin-dependent protein
VVAVDRPAEGEVEAIARLQRELEDLRSTVLARVSRRPTGDVEPTIRSTPKPDTLLLQGQVVSRTGYPVLWQWVQDQGLVVAGLFTSGDGSTTFGLPDFRGRVPIGAGTLGADNYALGALVGTARHTLTTTEMPGHTHTGSSSSEGHSHSASTNTTGGHGDHRPNVLPGVGGDDGSRWPTDFNGGGGSHSHTVSVGSSSHSHTVSIGSTGGGGAHENRQPSIAINWAVWT